MNRTPKRWTHYPYEHPSRPEQVAMWQRRMENVDGTPMPDGRTKNITYIRPCRPGNDDTRLAFYGKPPNALSDRLLYGLPTLRRAIALRVPAVLWCEGEKDCAAAEDLLYDAGLAVCIDGHLCWEGPAVSHHGGANKATPQQAEHFRGFQGRVYVAVDWDDAGAACALRRWRLLRAVGLRRVYLLRPADGALALARLPRGVLRGGVGSAADRDSLEQLAREWGCAREPGGGADLTDHADAGYGLRDLVRVRPAELRPAAARHQAHEAEGGRYGGSAFTPEERARAAADWARHQTRVTRKS